MKHSGLRFGGLATIVAAGLLAACGGGGGGGGGGSVTPVSTPNVTPTPTPTPTPNPGGNAPLPPISGNGSGYSPYDVATAFHFPVQSGFNGQGRTVAIIGDGTPAPADVTTYVAHFQVPYTGSFLQKNVTSTDSGTDTGGIAEATLDVETVIGLAPGANIVFYDTRNDLSNQAFLLAEQQAAADNPDALSISFGGCENYPTSTATPEPDTATFALLNTHGTAVTASSGDSGDQCSWSNPSQTFGVNYPASDPSVIGVGGNESLEPGPITTQVAWNDTSYSGATGGGVSAAYAIPSYQIGVSGVASTTKRNVPDVAMPAEDTLVYLNGKIQHYGGTSWSAPQVSAMMATLDQYCNGRPTNAVAELYKAYAQSNGADFIDVTIGNNKVAGDSGVTYVAKTGYDNTTGLGLLNGMAIAGTVCPSRSWQGGVMPAAMPMAVAANYGEAKDTVLGYRQPYASAVDRGERTNEETHVLVVLRQTPTLANDEQSVIIALQSRGFTVTQSVANHSMVQLSAPASVISGYFRTSIHNVDAGKYGMKYANAAPITLPAEIAPYVSTVLADNLPARVPLHHHIR